RLPRASARAAGQDRIAGALPAPARARAAEGPYAAERPTRVLTLRVRARSGTRGLLAQAGGASTGDRPRGRPRQPAAVAVAAAGPRVRRPRGRGIGATPGARPVRVLRVRPR